MEHEAISITQLSVGIDKKVVLKTLLDNDIIISDTNLTQYSFHDASEGDLCMRYDSLKYAFDINDNGELIAIFPEDQDFRIDENGELLQDINPYAIVDYEEGEEETAWSYNDPVRTKTITPWRRAVYENGEYGPYEYGIPQIITETATETYKYSDWEYNADNSSRHRNKTKVYQYKDINRNGASEIITENGTVSYGEWTYSDPTRSRTVTYTYSSDDTTKSGTPQTETATVSTTEDGYWNGSCGTDYYYEDYVKQRSVYSYSDTTREGSWVNGAKRRRRVDGQCGWEKTEQTTDWVSTGKTCDANGNEGKFSCDGDYTVIYNQESRTKKTCYPDGSGATDITTEYRANGVHSRTQVQGQCGYNPVVPPSKEQVKVTLEFQEDTEASMRYQVRANIAKAVGVDIKVTYETDEEDTGTLTISANQLHSDWQTIGRNQNAKITSVTPTSTDSYEIIY